MIDIKLLRENPEKVAQATKNKGIDIDVEKILKLDKECRKISTIAQELVAKRNKTVIVTPDIFKEFTEQIKSKNFSLDILEEAIKLKEEIRKKEKELKKLEEKLLVKLLSIPNIPKDDVKVGKDELENEVIKKHGEPAKLSFSPKDHLELGENLDLIDVKRAAKVSGTRFGYLKNEGALLEFALINLAFEILIKEGFTPIVPPVLIKEESMKGLGYMENGGEEDMFSLSKDNLYLVGTAEHAIVPMHKDEIFNKKNLPLRYVGFSSAFRREAGSYGKDTKGIFRVHQFDKVEMVSFTTEEEDNKEYDYLLSLEEELFQMLEIPYQVVKMCTGDLGFPAAAKKDIEAWMPAQNKYREVTSVSQVTDFQSRRLNIKYQDGNEKRFVYVLNGTAFAIGRTIISILENYQQEDGSIIIPKILQKYIGKEKIFSKK